MMPSVSQRTGLALRGSPVKTLAPGWIAEVALAWILGGRLGFGPWFVVKAALLFGGSALIVVRAAGHGHPFDRFGAANLVTTIRLAVVVLVAACTGEAASPTVAFGVALASVLVAASDGIDGWLARRTGLASAFGARFDMEVDALLVLVLSVLIWQYGKAGPWIVLAGLLRYLFVLSGWAWTRMRAPLFPSLRRKAVCVLQIVGLSAVMLPALSPRHSTWLAALLLLALSGSFLTDIVWLWQRHD